MRTKWNDKLKKHAGKYISCDKYEKDGIETEGYIINEDGTLGFRNTKKSLNVDSEIYRGMSKSYWDTRMKGAFLKAAQELQ